MKLQQLHHYLGVIEHGNFTRAAEALAISQPALTASIAKLEDDLGVKLLVRGRFGAVPTEYGAVLVKRARLINTELQLARCELDAMRGCEGGHLSVGVGPLFTETIVPEVILLMNRLHPGITVELIEGTSVELFEDLLHGKFDVVVSTPSLTIEADPELSQQTLFVASDVLLVRAGHPLVAKEVVLASDLVDCPWIVSARVDGVRRAVFALLAAEVGAMPRTVLRTDSMSVARYLLLNGDYITVGSARAAPLAHDAGQVRVLPFRDLHLRRQGAVTVRRRSPPSAASRVFIAMLTAVCKERVAQWGDPV